MPPAAAPPPPRRVLIPDLSAISPEAVALAVLVNALPRRAVSRIGGRPMPPSDPDDAPGDWAYLEALADLADGAGLGEDARCDHGERAGALAESVPGGLDGMAAGLAARLEAVGTATADAVRCAVEELAEARARAAPGARPAPPVRTARPVTVAREPAAAVARGGP